MADQRIQAYEDQIGANHPTLADTLNKLCLVEHSTDGTHKVITGSPTATLGATSVTTLVTSGQATIVGTTLSYNSDYSAGAVGSGWFFTMAAPSGDTTTLLQAFKAGNSAGANLAINKDGGNVLIGTATDNTSGAKLQVGGNFSAFQYICKTSGTLSTAGLAYTSFQDTSEKGWIGYGLGNGSLGITNIVGSININPNTSVLINTDTNNGSGAKLQVNGAATIGQTTFSDYVQINSTNSGAVETGLVLQDSGSGINQGTNIVWRVSDHTSKNLAYIGGVTVVQGMCLTFGTSYDNVNSIERMRITNEGNIVLSSIPTSSSGLASGTVWSDGGTLKIIP